MSEQKVEQGDMTREEMMSGLFANMVVQNSNMALIFLGHAPHPQTGNKEINLDNARYFIDQLEMIEAKTKGNLDKQEEGLLKQSLTSLRMAFVEAVQQESAQPAVAPAKEESNVETKSAPPEGGAEKQDEDSKKKFSKKY
ncbi:MAG: hypothetical protein JWO95_2738 [Verrucomicrobiales bacterium]|nr:hypothetical protein [Verrucomicrobiales bacterium]